MRLAARSVRRPGACCRSAFTASTVRPACTSSSTSSGMEDIGRSRPRPADKMRTTSGVSDVASVPSDMSRVSHESPLLLRATWSSASPPPVALPLRARAEWPTCSPESIGRGSDGQRPEAQALVCWVVAADPGAPASPRCATSHRLLRPCCRAKASRTDARSQTGPRGFESTRAHRNPWIRQASPASRRNSAASSGLKMPETSCIITQASTSTG
jgi:hypothetical protein